MFQTSGLNEIISFRLCVQVIQEHIQCLGGVTSYLTAPTNVSSEISSVVGLYNYSSPTGYLYNALTDGCSDTTP